MAYCLQGQNHFFIFFRLTFYNGYNNITIILKRIFCQETQTKKRFDENLNLNIAQKIQYSLYSNKNTRTLG